jgi:protein TonB
MEHEPAERVEPAPAPDADDIRTRAADPGQTPDVPAVPTIPAPPAPEPVTEAVSEPPKAPDRGENAQSKPKETKRPEKTAARPEGGITSKAKTGKGTGSARISASSGALLAYRSVVQACVSANRPSGGTPGSTAVVVFGLTTSGAIAYARIERSSGDVANDRLALAATRGAGPCPPPPAGANPAQLQFRFPYDFR